MSDDLRVVREYDDGVYTVTATVENPSVLPLEIFLYENNEGELGDYYAVCTLENLNRPKFTPGMESFGVKFVRYTEATKQFYELADAVSFENAIVGRVNQLYLELTENVDYVKVYDITGA